MPTQALTEIITKALTDEAFRKHLLENPEKAIESYDLAENEAKMLRNLKPEAFEALETDVEERQSKSGLGMGLGSLISGRDLASGDISNLINVLMNKYG